MIVMIVPFETGRGQTASWFTAPTVSGDPADESGFARERRTL